MISSLKNKMHLKLMSM